MISPVADRHGLRTGDRERLGLLAAAAVGVDERQRDREPRAGGRAARAGCAGRRSACGRRSRAQSSEAAASSAGSPAQTRPSGRRSARRRTARRRAPGRARPAASPGARRRCATRRARRRRAEPQHGVEHADRLGPQRRAPGGGEVDDERHAGRVEQDVAGEVGVDELLAAEVGVVEPGDEPPDQVGEARLGPVARQPRRAASASYACRSRQRPAVGPRVEARRVARGTALARWACRRWAVARSVAQVAARRRTRLEAGRGPAVDGEVAVAGGHRQREPQQSAATARRAAPRAGPGSAPARPRTRRGRATARGRRPASSCPARPGAAPARPRPRTGRARGPAVGRVSHVADARGRGIGTLRVATPPGAERRPGQTGTATAVGGGA